MKWLVWLAILAWVSSCSSLRTTVYESVTIGTEKDKVASALGQPDAFQTQNQSGTDVLYWWYQQDNEYCWIGFVANRVGNFSCEKNGPGRFLRTLGAILQGAGQGLQNSSQRGTTCQSTTVGNSTQTNCQ